MTFQPKAPHKGSRWLALFGALLLLTGFTVAPVAALPVFVYVPDDGGPNDQPGQKDLTAQASDLDNGSLYTAWKWDDTSWSGNNTGDGCSLFDNDGDGLVDYAACATVEGGVGPSAVTIDTVTFYSCNNTRTDRCAGPTQLFFADTTAGTYCTVIDQATGQFGGTDTEIQCNISAIVATTGVTDVGSLWNTCSYPSREPNSDPSDCVVTVPAQPTTTTTTPSGSATFTATLNDSATVSNNGQGTVTFKLFSDATCTTQVFTATVNTNASGVATTSTTVTVADTYYWTADFTPTDPGDFDPSSSACGLEVVTVTGASVSVP